MTFTQMKRWQKNILVKPKKTKKRLRKKTQNAEIFFWKKKNVEKPHLHQRLHHWSKVVTIQWRLGFPSSRSGGSKLAVPYSLVYTDLWAAHTHLAKALALRHRGGHTAGGCATAHDDLRNYWSQKKRSLRARAILMTWIEATDFGESQVMGEQVGWKGAVVDETFETLNWRFIVTKCIFYNLRIHVALGCNEKNPPKDTHEIADLPLPSYPTFPLAKCPPYLLK